jgi:hypothetical protein
MLAVAGRFCGMRWRGERPLARLFWLDIVVVASLVNAATSIASLAMLAGKMPLWAALVVFFLPAPLNLFLTACVWRHAGRSPDAVAAFGYQVGSALWLAAATAL